MQYNAYIGIIMRNWRDTVYDFENMDKRLIAYVNIFICANRLQAIMDKGMMDITAKQTRRLFLSERTGNIFCANSTVPLLILLKKSLVIIAP